MINPYTECPRFQKCSVNNCPLHQKYPDLLVNQEDHEPKCTMEKQVRFKIGSKYPDILKFQGLTSKEWAGKQRFESLPDKDKEAIRLRAKHTFLSCSQIQHENLMVMEQGT